jgi:DnaJ-class molecular chaperone
MDLDFYYLLRIQRDANQQQIDWAFRREMGRKATGWLEKFRFALEGRTPERITRAYETLSNSAQRARYDEDLADSCRWPIVFPQ